MFLIRSAALSHASFAGMHPIMSARCLGDVEVRINALP